MSLETKTNLWVENNLISLKQKENIIAFEKDHNKGFLSKTALIIAGLFIGLGVCLMVAANWDILPTSVKIIADFALWIGFAYGAYRTFEKKQFRLQDMFLFLCFLMTAATIGLIAQTFQLNGPWTSFATFWALVSLPYVLLSSSFSLGTMWIVVFVSGLIGDIFDKFLEYMFESMAGIMSLVLICGALSYAFEMLYRFIKNKIFLLHVISKLMLFGTYFAFITLLFGYALPNHYNPHFTYFAVLFVLAFFVYRLFWAFYKQNMPSFKRNTLMFEAYIFFFFASLFDNLLTSGIGFILVGLFILLMFYVFQKTSKRIQKWEIFK